MPPDQAARTARAAKNHTAAAQAWRTLLDQSPNDWRLALELKQDLEAGYHNPDSDPHFRQAARALPDAEWQAHYSARGALPGAELDHIAARARTLPQDNAPIQALQGQVARHRQDWPEAARAFTAAAELDPQNPDHPAHAAEARLYARLAANPWPNTGPEYDTIVINLDRNTDRMTEIARRFDTPFRRLSAVDGARLPRAAAARLTGNAHAPRGTLGCFLSHVAAWESLLASQAPAALIIEDDAIPLLPLPPRLGGLNLPPAWDVVWVNDRMQPRRDPAAQAFTTQPAPTTIQAFKPWHDAIGTDGYLISRPGARKLLDWTAEDGLAHDVDWRMAAYALNLSDIETLPQAARHQLHRLSPRPPRATRLDAHALHPALIRDVGLSSDRQDTDRGDPTP